MKFELLDAKNIGHYPSGSGIEFFDDRLYLIGDDAKDMLVMNKKWKKPELINLFEGTEDRIPKPEKADLEATAIIYINEIPQLLVLGSGSLEPRNKAVLFNFESSEQKVLDISVFYERLKTFGIESLNIEGAALVHDKIVLCNRGNKSNPVNHLIITDPDFYENQENAEIKIMRIEFEKSDNFMGISGLTYSDKHEFLIFTVSSEDTKDAIADGKIGKSYLGFIDNIYRKIYREKEKLKINTLIDLNQEDKIFKGHKIESVCIQSEKDHSVKLHLAADDDDGTSWLFKVQVWD